MRKLLLTGFEPFDGMESNLSTDIVKEFTNIQSLILPVTFNEAFKQLKPVVEDIKPDVLLLFGLADIRDKVTIERIAINTLHARITDNEGHQPQHELIQKTGTDGIF
jgi:pyroglutamyl-peptidase